MKHRKGEAVNGWLIVDKPQGIGSTQVVTLTRRLFNAQKTAIPALWIRLPAAFCRSLSAKRPN